MKPRLLYLMHVPWGWIKQRPHFFAENLSKDFNLTVCYRKPLTVNEKDLKEEKNNDFSIKSFISIPFQKIPILKYIPWIGIINSILLYLNIRNISKFDYIWICSPVLYSIVKPFIRKDQIVIYDCMDDMISFPDNAATTIQNHIKATENELLRRANLNIFSSDYLRDTILNRYKMKGEKTILINNAIEIPMRLEITYPAEIDDKLQKFDAIKNTFLYIGTIEKWLDFDIILRTLHNNSEINFVLIGPTRVMIPKHPRIHYFGIIKRDFIFEFMRRAKALVMPFIVTDLIKSVNPVKLYEYIWENKPIVAPKYGESEKFGRFVYLYNDTKEFIELCNQIVDNKIEAKASIDMCHQFVENNTWINRYDELSKVISSLK